MKLNLTLDNLDKILRANAALKTPRLLYQAKTRLLKNISLLAHNFYGGKTATCLKAPIFNPAWLNIYYTPGVSSVSLALKADKEQAFALSNRANCVAVVSDGTRVLGDGDCGPQGALGVMEGKAMLMKYFGGIDAHSLCIDSRGADGKPSAQKIIDFVKMVSPSYGAINLEDISQPNCYYVLDALKKECDIPVWHDDAQGTACVVCAAFLNALKLARKKIENAKIILYGSGAANTSIAAFLAQLGARPQNIIMFDSKSALHKNREDLKNNPASFKQWELCKITNPSCLKTQEEAFKGADAVIALSASGPNVLKKEWIKLMASKAIVFACANPIPEIYPQDALEAGAFIVATGRGDFANQVNNSLCFPGILKGALLCRAKAISDEMALSATQALAQRARRLGLERERILPPMDDDELYALEAAAVVKTACKQGLARRTLSGREAYEETLRAVKSARGLNKLMLEKGFFKPFPKKLLDEALRKTLKEIKSADL